MAKSTRGKAETDEVEELAGSAGSDAPAAEPAKPARRSPKAAVKVADAEQPAKPARRSRKAATGGAPQPEPAAEKPKRARKKAAEEPAAAQAQPEPAAEKPKRARKKAAEEPAAAKAEPAEVPEAPARRGRKKKEPPPPEPEEEQEPERQAGPAEEAIPEEAKWYVVHTYSGYENKVKQNLEHRIESMGMLDQIFHVVVPVEEEVDIKDGQRRIVARKIFPGYVLVRMILTDESWSVVRNTPAVTGFVGSGTDASDRLRPTPLRQEDVDRILRRMEAEEPTIRVSFRTGQNVRIVDGPFTDFHGVVDSIDVDRGKVRLMVNFFGRETPVELDFLQVEKV